MEVKADKELQLKQDPQMVWKVMTDPALMVVSVPGAELTETLDERNFKGKIGIKIGPVTASSMAKPALPKWRNRITSSLWKVKVQMPEGRAVQI